MFRSVSLSPSRETFRFPVQSFAFMLLSLVLLSYTVRLAYLGYEDYRAQKLRNCIAAHSMNPMSNGMTRDEIRFACVKGLGF